MTGWPVAAVRGVTVDLDDTIFPQQQWLAGAWRAVAEQAGTLGLDGPRLLLALDRLAAEGSDRGRIVDRALVAIGAAPDRYVAPLVAAFTAHAPPSLTGYRGALEALARLRDVVPVVLVTDGNPAIQRAKIAALGLDALVDFVVVSDELGGRELRKPHPAPFLRALELLRLPAAEVVHVGDRPAKDLVGAAAVGMRAVLVRTGEYADSPGSGVAPWAVVDAFHEAVDLLLDLAVRAAVPASVPASVADARTGEHPGTPARL